MTGLRPGNELWSAEAIGGFVASQVPTTRELIFPLGLWIFWICRVPISTGCPPAEHGSADPAMPRRRLLPIGARAVVCWPNGTFFWGIAGDSETTLGITRRSSVAETRAIRISSAEFESFVFGADLLQTMQCYDG